MSGDDETLDRLLGIVTGTLSGVSHGSLLSDPWYVSDVLYGCDGADDVENVGHDPRHHYDYGLLYHLTRHVHFHILIFLFEDVYGLFPS